VQRRAVRALEVGRPTGVDVEAAAAGAAELFFDRLDATVGVESGDRRLRAAARCGSYTRPARTVSWMTAPAAAAATPKNPLRLR